MQFGKLVEIIAAAEKNHNLVTKIFPCPPTPAESDYQLTKKRNKNSPCFPFFTFEVGASHLKREKGREVSEGDGGWGQWCAG